MYGQKKLTYRSATGLQVAPPPDLAQGPELVEWAGFRGVLTKNTGAGICFTLRGGLPAAASTFAKATVDKLLARHSFSDGGRTLR